MNGIKQFVTKHKVILGIIAAVIVVACFAGYKGVQSYKKKKQTEADIAWIEANNATTEDSTDKLTGTSSLLISMQDSLTESYGEAPDGFVWDMDGTLISIGDSSMTAEEVVYAYLQALSKLDIDAASKYSRKASTVSQYSKYYDSTSYTSYSDQFNRNMYAAVLKSIQIDKVESTSTFSANKQVFTVSATIIDLTNKDFWLNDRQEVFETLYTYGVDESDSTKADQYLYEYILSYFDSDVAITRTVTFDLTLEKLTDFNTGWLVTGDGDLNNACIYKDGTTVLTYIKEQYYDYLEDLYY